MLSLYVNAIINGLMVGTIYALIATGLNVIFGVMRAVNFAHGEMVVVGMYIGFLCWKILGLPPLAAVPISALTMFIGGYTFQRAIGNDFVDKPQHIQFVLYIGLGLTITGLQALIFGADPLSIQGESGFVAYRLGMLRIDSGRLNAAAAALVLILALWAWLRFSLAGKALHAAAENLTGGKAIGIRIPHVFALAAGIGMSCAGAAGALIAPLFDVTPYLSHEFTLTAFIIVIVGGLASLPGALVGGLLIGVSEAVAAILIEPSAKSALSYLLLIVMLLIRPEGLFSSRRTSR